MSSLDHDVRAGFDALREQDGASAPEFRGMCAAAVPRAGITRRRLRRGVWLAAAAAACIAVASTIVVSRRAREKLVQINPEVLNWRAPTDGLLRMSRQVTRFQQPILGSALDSVGAPSVRTNSSTGGED